MGARTLVRQGAAQPDSLRKDEIFLQHAAGSSKLLGIWVGNKSDKRKCAVPHAVQHPGDGNDYVMQPEDKYVGLDTTSGTAQVTLPDPSDIEDGHEVIIDDEGGNANGNNITVATPGDEHIEGSDTATISTNDATTRYVWDEAGANWVQV